MRRIPGIIGLALLLAALLTVFVTGSIMGASDNAEAAQNNYETCPRDAPYGDDIPNDWGEPGPHGDEDYPA